MTALKTVSLRLRATATDISEMGEDADGAAETVSKLRDQLLALTNGKVDIQLDEDTYKSTYQIMLEMSKVWNEMTDMSQASALELMFGKRQANIGASIISNMETAQQALNTALDSTGSAMSENEKYLDSINGKLTQLKANTEVLATTAIDNESIKGIIDLASNAIEVINILIDKLGSIPVVLSAITGVLTATGKLNFVVDYNDLKNLDSAKDKLLYLKDSIKDTFKSSNANDLADGIDNIGNSASKATIKTKMLSAAISTIGSMVVIGAIQLVIGYLGDLANKYEELRQEAIDSTKKTVESLNILSSLKNEYLSIVDSQNSEIEKSKELSTWKDKLIEQYGLERDAVKEINLEREKGISILDKESAAQRNAWIVKNSDMYDEAVSQMEAPYFTSNEYSGEYSNLKKIVDDLDLSFVKLTKDANGIARIKIVSDNVSEQKKKIDEVVAALKRQQDSVKGLSQEEKTYLSNMSGLSDALDDVISNYGDLYNQGNEILAQDLFSNFVKENPLSEIVDQASYDKFVSKLESMAGASQGVKNALTDLAENTFPDFAKSEEEAAESTEKVLSSIETFALGLQGIKDDSIKTFASNVTERLGVVKDQFDSGKISASEYFRALQSEANNVDFSEYTQNLESANEAQAHFFTYMTTELTSGLGKLFNDFENGTIGVVEYSEAFIESADLVSQLTDVLQSNANAWMENSEGIKSASEEIDGMQSNLESASDSLSGFLDSMYLAQQINVGEIQIDTDEFTAATEIIAEDLASIVEQGGAMAQEIQDVLGTSSSEIQASLQNDVSNMGIASQAIAQNATTSIQDLAKNTGTLIQKLGESIANFKVELSLNTKINGYTPVEVSGHGFLSKLLNFQVPNVTFTVEPTGSTKESLANIGNAISDFGTSLANSAPTIDLGDLFKVNENSPLPGEGALDRYNNKLDSLKDKASGSGASKKPEDPYKKQHDALQEVIKDLEFQIFLLEKQGATAEDIVPIYKEIQKKIEDQIADFNAQGLDANDDYVQELIRQWYDYNDKIIDAYEQTQNELEQQMDDFISSQRAIFDGYMRIIDQQIDALRKQRQAVSDYWDAQIDAYRQAHEEQERQNRLEEKAIKLKEEQIRLENIKKQKILIYKKGQGFVTDVDQIAVDEQQKVVDDAQKDYDQTKADIEYERHMDWLEKQKEAALDAIDAEIEALEGLKEEWTNLIEGIEEGINTNQEQLDAWKEFSEASFEEQKEILASFAENYRSQLQSIQAEINATIAAIQALQAAMASMGGGGGGAPMWKGQSVSAAQANSWAANGWSYVGSMNGGTWVKDGQLSYANGTDYARAGLAKINEHGKELVILNGGESILPAQISKNLRAFGMTSPEQLVSKAAGSISSMLQSVHSSQVTKYIFGDLNFPNVHDGNDVKSFINSLKSITLRAEQSINKI